VEPPTGVSKTIAARRLPRKHSNIYSAAIEVAAAQAVLTLGNLLSAVSISGAVSASACLILKLDDVTLLKPICFFKELRQGRKCCRVDLIPMVFQDEAFVNFGSVIAFEKRDF